MYTCINNDKNVSSICCCINNYVDKIYWYEIMLGFRHFIKLIVSDTYEMITESSDGSGYQFVVSYHFESNVRAGGDRSHPARVKRLAQETVTLSTSLPLSYSSSVFVRCDADRLDIMKVFIHVDLYIGTE